ncbi:uncharacterized protein LOC112685741, partial [Sipha flava]|uniref:Uncharacterized protein LOC112685741 n=1 Tax=Sipha flava TaxID=143950 RepID=A0A8B8FT16_9HEMI
IITLDTLNPSIIDLPEYIECFDNNKPNTQNDFKFFSFWTLQENFNSIILPTAWSRHDIPEKLIMFSCYTIIKEETEMPTPIILKRVCLNTDLKVTCSVLGKDISENIFGLAEINNI